MKYFLAIALLWMSNANAVVYDFSGVIDVAHIRDPNNITGISVGSRFDGFFDYDPSNLVPEVPGVFTNGVRSYELRLGSHIYTSGANLGLIALFTGDDAATFTDLRPRDDSPDIIVDDITFTFKGISGVPSSLDQFESARLAIPLFIGNSPSSATILGDITSFVRSAAVPEPGTYVLYVVGLFGVFLAHRFRRRVTSNDEQLGCALLQSS